jgi:hypothetical protein
MTDDLDKLFAAQQTELHPKAQAWLQRIRQGQRAVVEVVRKRDVLSYRPPRLFIRFDDVDVQDEPWDASLNEALVNARVRAKSAENEALRLALMLSEWFERPASRFGDDYFNSVLVEYLKSDPFRALAPVAEVLRDVHAYAPSQGTSSYSECHDEVQGIFARGARALTQLGYPLDDAKKVLARAIAQFLDDRFSITHRKALGLWVEPAPNPLRSKQGQPCRRPGAPDASGRPRRGARRARNRGESRSRRRPPTRLPPEARARRPRRTRG